MRLCAMVCGGLLTAATIAATVNTGDVTWHFHGFASAGYSQSNSDAAYGIPGHGSVKNAANFSALSLVGLQAEADFAKQWAAVMQLVANGEDRNGHSEFRPEVEWAFLRFSPNQDWQLRAGRFRMPTFMFSATQEVGYSYPWVTLPNEVYRLVPFSNINGVETIYRHQFSGSSWTLHVEPYFGENRSKYDLPIMGANQPLTEVNFKENNLYGANVSIGNPEFRLRGAYAHTSLTATLPNGVVTVNDKSTSFYGVGVHADVDHFLFDGEWAHRDTPVGIAALTGYYAMLGYRYHQWLPNLTYGHLKTTNADKVEPALREAQQSYTLGVDYYINSHMIAKASVSRVTPLDGTYGLFDNNPGKKHVNLYMVSLNAVF